MCETLNTGGGKPDFHFTVTKESGACSNATLIITELHIIYKTTLIDLKREYAEHHHILGKKH